MTTRTIHSPAQIPALVTLIQNRKLPVTVTITEGASRSSQQNRMQHKWFSEISEQLGDRTAEEVRAQTKLEIGVPILRAENEAFRETYDRLIRPMGYEDKIEAMIRFDIPITRLMTVKQHGQFLDEMFRRYTNQGVVLTMPEDA